MFDSAVVQDEQTLTGAPLDVLREMCRLRTSAAKNHEIDEAIHEEHQSAEHPLHFARQRVGIQRGDDVTLHEAGRIGRSATALAQPVLQRRERAEPAGELNPGAPACGRKVQPGDSPPAQYEQPAEYNEQHERTVDDDGEIGQESEPHRRPGSQDRAGISAVRALAPMIADFAVEGGSAKFGAC